MVARVRLLQRGNKLADMNFRRIRIIIISVLPVHGNMEFISLLEINQRNALHLIVNAAGGNSERYFAGSEGSEFGSIHGNDRLFLVGLVIEHAGGRIDVPEEIAADLAVDCRIRFGYFRVDFYNEPSICCPRGFW